MKDREILDDMGPSAWLAWRQHHGWRLRIWLMWRFRRLTCGACALPFYRDRRKFRGVPRGATPICRECNPIIKKSLNSPAPLP